MRLHYRLLGFLAVASVALSCSASFEEEPYELTLRIRLHGDKSVGSTPARIYFYDAEAGVPRFAVIPQGARSCALTVTPETICHFTVQPGRVVTLIATESDPGVESRIALASPDDTVRSGGHIEFLGWSECQELLDRGACVLKTGTRSVEATYQLMTQVVIYQTGVSYLDWLTFGGSPMLKVPPNPDNILDGLGCQSRLQFSGPCDDLRFFDDEPRHRYTIHLSRGMVLGVFPFDAANAHFIRWDGDCLLSQAYPGGPCSIVAPDTAALEPIVLTLRHEWWDCPEGPREQDIGFCILRGADAAARSRDQAAAVAKPKP